MSQLEKLFIAATGMTTPLGMNTAMTAAAINAGINVYQASAICDGFFSPITMTEVPEDALAPLASPLKNQLGINARQARLLRLAQPALTEALNGLKQSLAIFLAGPEPLPNAPLPIRSKFLEHLQVQAGVAFDLDHSKVFPMGRAGVFYALEYAFSYLEFSDQDYVLVGGVDSYWHPMTLAALTQEQRLKTERGQTDGFVPGEAAGFILLSRQPVNSTGRQVYRPGLAEESGHRYSQEPHLGEGLSAAFKQALAQSSLGNIQKIYSSLNGEAFAAKEYGVALTRNSAALAEKCAHLHPADCYGDLGAATGAILIALSAINSPGTAICYGSSEGAFRGAACVI